MHPTWRRQQSESNAQLHRLLSFLMHYSEIDELATNLIL